METDLPKTDESACPRIGGMGVDPVTGVAVFVEGAVETPAETPVGDAEVPKNVLQISDLLAAREAQRLKELEDRLRRGESLSASELKQLKAAVGRERQGLRADVAIDEAVGEAGVNAWWVNGAGAVYFVKDAGSEWLEVPESKLALMLRRRGVSPVPQAGSVLTPLEEAVMHIMEQRTLDRSIEALAGYGSGIYEVKGRRILVRTAPKFVEPKAGEWPFIESFLAGRLMLDSGDVKADRVQFDRFNWWMKRAVENFYASPDMWLNSHILILAGPAGCGKSRIQHNLITPILGGRSADPSLYVFGDTTFNEGWMGAPHLLIEDPKPSTKMLDRLQLAQILKGLAVNEDHSYHGKGRGEFIVDPQFVVTVSINDDPDALRILPALTPDFADKVMLLHVQDREFPLPTGSAAERRAFQERITAELSAYVHWLLHECVVPEELQGGRFGVREYHAPELKLTLWEDSPAGELLALLDVARWDDASAGKLDFWRQDGADTVQKMKAEGMFNFTKRATAARRLVELAEAGGYRVWCGSSDALQGLLEKVVQKGVADKIIKHNQVGRLLARLAEDCPDRVADYRDGHGRRLWVIRAATLPDTDANVAEF